MLTKWTTGIFGHLMKAISSERKRALASITEDIRKLTKWNAFLDSHRIGDRCLTCGSSDVRPVKLPTKYFVPAAIGAHIAVEGRLWPYQKAG